MGSSASELPFSEACERNKGPIGQALERLLAPRARVLEIGAGTGQHAVHFSALRPDVQWQASDRAENLPGLVARFEREAAGRLSPPLALDVRDSAWPRGPFDAIYTANTLHIMPFKLTPVLLDRAAQCLRPGGLLICYGPFSDGGVHHAASNARFDQQLRQRDPQMGIRDALEVTELARLRGLVQQADLALPANNRLLVFCLLSDPRN
jgi:SAM-dependent methyltransferase